MNRPLFHLTAAYGLLLALSTEAQIVQNYSATPNITIPDGDPVGVSQSVDLPANISSITDVSMTLQVAGGFTGDYFAYLKHGSDIVVLLNRLGRDPSNQYGYFDGGLNISLSDAAANGDIHVYQTVSNPSGGTLTGTWAPDGRTTSPYNVVTSDSRTASFSQLDGLSSGGTWTLFVSDLSTGGVGILDGWSLSITGSLVPEPGQWAWAAGGALALLAAARRIGEKRHGR